MINKQQFEDAYRKFPPDNIEKFFLKNISIYGMPSNVKYVIILIILLLIPLIIETVIYTLGLPNIYRVFPNLFYAFLMATFGILWFVVLRKKQKRCNKIIKYLGITKEEFKEITKNYYHNRYSSDDKFIQFNCKNKQ